MSRRPQIPAWAFSRPGTIRLYHGFDQARPGQDGAAEAGPQKYLHIDMQYIEPSVTQNLDKFRIVDANGNEVGEYWGNDPSKAVIFESHSRWDSLTGLYLDGFGHREPLFDQVVVRPGR